MSAQTIQFNFVANAQQLISGANQGAQAMGRLNQAATQGTGGLNRFGQGTNTAAQGAQRLGAAGTQGAAGMNRMSQGAAQAASSSQRLGQSIQAAGAFIGATIGGVASLVSEFASLERAQFAVQRATDAYNRSQTAVQAAQDRVNKLVAQGKTDTPEYALAVNRLSDAQDKEKTAEERLQLVQNQLNERMLEFAGNIIPNVIQVVTGAVAAYQEMSIAMRGVTEAEAGLEGAMAAQEGIAVATAGEFGGLSAAQGAAAATAADLGTEVNNVATAIGGVNDSLLIAERAYVGVADTAGPAATAISEFGGAETIAATAAEADAAAMAGEAGAAERDAIAFNQALAGASRKAEASAASAAAAEGNATAMTAEAVAGERSAASTGLLGRAFGFLRGAMGPILLIITAIAGAFIAYATNAFGARDGMNAFGKAIGDAIPPLQGFLNLLKTGGEGLAKLLGIDIPKTADKSQDAINGITDSFDDAQFAAAQYGDTVGFIGGLPFLPIKKESIVAPWKEGEAAVNSYKSGVDRAAEAGKNLGTQIGESVKKGVASLQQHANTWKATWDQFWKKAQAPGGLADQVGGAFADEYAKAKPHIDALQQAAGNVWEQALGVVDRTLPKILDRINGFSNNPAVKGFASGILDALNKIGAVAGPIVVNLLQRLADFFSTFDPVAAFDATVKFFQELPGRIAGFMLQIPAALGNLGAQIQTAIVNGLINIGNVIGALILNGLKSLANLGAQIFTWITSGLTNIGQAIAALILNGIKTLSNLGAQIQTWIMQGLSNIGAVIAKFITTGLESIKGWVLGMPGNVNQIIESIKGALGNIKGWVLGLPGNINKIRDGVVSVLEGIKNWVLGLPKLPDIVGTIKGAIEKFAWSLPMPKLPDILGGIQGALKGFKWPWEGGGDQGGIKKSALEGPGTFPGTFGDRTDQPNFNLGGGPGGAGGANQFQTLVAAAQQAVAQIVTIFQTVAPVIAQTFGNAVSVGQQILMSLPTIATTAVAGMVTVFQTLPQVVAQTFGTAVSVAQQVLTSLVTIATTAIAGLVPVFQTLPSIAAQTFGTLASVAQQILNSLPTIANRAAGLMAQAISAGVQRSIASLKAISSGAQSELGKLPSIANQAAGQMAQAISAGSQRASASLNSIVSSANRAAGAVRAVASAINALRDRTVTLTVIHRDIFVVQRVFAAKGFHGVVSSPTQFTVGEGNRPEMVNVTPLGQSSDSRTTVNQFQQGEGKGRRGGKGGSGNGVINNNINAEIPISIDIGGQVVRVIQKKLLKSSTAIV